MTLEQPEGWCRPATSEEIEQARRLLPEALKPVLGPRAKLPVSESGGTVGHQHGQHGPHWHSEEGYLSHPRPIEDEAILQYAEPPFSERWPVTPPLSEVPAHTPPATMRVSRAWVESLEAQAVRAADYVDQLVQERCTSGALRRALAEALDGWAAADSSGSGRTTGQDADRIAEIRRKEGL